MTSAHAALPRLRRTLITDDTVLLVRGESDAEPDASVQQAVLFRRRFPAWARFGLSAFSARSDDEMFALGADRLATFRELIVHRTVDVVAADFGVVPTFRSPHMTITFYDEPQRGVARLRSVRHRRPPNPGFEGHHDND